MLKFISFVFLFFLGVMPFYISAQGNSLLIGKVKNPTKDYLIITVDKTYLNNRIIEEVLLLNEEGKFGVSCPMEIAQKIRLTYNQKSIDLFLAPTDTLILTIDGKRFPEGLKFEGSAAKDNQVLQAFEQTYPKDLNQFKFRYYYKGTHCYKIHEDKDKEMQQTLPVDYLKNQRRKQALQQAFIASQGVISKSLQQYLQGELHYSFLYEQLTYGHIYKTRHSLDDSYFYFMDSLSYFSDQALAHPTYRAFLKAWVNFKLEGLPLADSTQTIYAQQYFYVKKYLDGFSKYWMMAELLKQAFERENPMLLTAIYKDFLLNNPYREFDQIVTDAFQRTQKFAVGSPAPTFLLKDIDGKSISLRDFQGKVVYLDFWASWCKPCMKKLKNFHYLETALAGKEVVFLHVNLDKNITDWQKTVKKHNFGGIQLYNHEGASITKDYEVLSVPKFFLITKQGNFAYTPSVYKLEELNKIISKLAKNK